MFRMDEFISTYRRIVDENRNNSYQDNYDHRTFGPPAAPKTLLTRKRIERRFKDFLVRIGVRNRRDLLTSEQLEQLGKSFELLRDRESAELFLALLAYRTLGHTKVKLPTNTPWFWSTLDELEGMAQAAETLDLPFREWTASLFDLSRFGYPVRLFARPMGVMTQFLLEQYRCALDGDAIEVEPGDIVIDAGGCWGDTALYLAYKAGARGTVASYEFLPENLGIFRRNLELNPELAPRIRIVEHPTWSVSGEMLSIDVDGPASRVGSRGGATDSRQVESLSIDDLIERQGLGRADFIKMDIEGSELEALRGAEATLRRCRPKLAISIYHRLQDFWEIPLWLNDLDLGYEFHVRHFTIHQGETVLFARGR
jgi:FkbM family methyltransferase